MNRGLINSKYLVSSDVSLLNPDKVRELLHECIWSKHVPISYIKKFITTSLCFGVYEKSSNEQLGFSRVISDGMSYSYVTDVVLDKVSDKNEYSNALTFLLESIRRHPELQGLREWRVIVDDNTRPIFAKFGFMKAEHPETIFEKSAD